MREILFRGKSKVRGDWVEGCLVRRYNGYVGIDRPHPDLCFELIQIEPETVGQYTGLTDKNGNKIFEGDILEGDLEDSLDPGARWRSIVVWGTFGWMCKDRQCLPMDAFDILEGEVIGNIHDNLELLEVEEHE